MTPAPADAAAQGFLSDVIIARRLVDPAAMQAALRASLTGRSLTEILVASGSLDEDDLARTLAEHHRLDHVDLEVFPVDRDAAAMIGPDVARRLGAVPIAILPDGSVVVALYDPNGSTAVIEFAQLTRRTIQPAVASRTQIEALIESLRADRFAMSAAHPADAPPESRPDSACGERPAPVAAADVETQDRARAAQELALAAEEVALAAQARATDAFDAVSAALARLAAACDTLAQRVNEGGDLASRVAELEQAIGTGQWPPSDGSVLRFGGRSVPVRTGRG